ncbi:MAG: leucine-rich repeat domain-containing protein [Treponema sp.]|nr:leucine-rich repeat domain-containing protein [Treponema sp.]
MNKKTVFLLFWVLSACFTVSAQQIFDPESDFQVRSVNNGRSMEITDYIGARQTVRIPRRIQGLLVTGIGESAFHDKEVIRVIIPDSVTSIGDKAFSLCSGLTEITIPNSVTFIGDMAFWGCTSLVDIIIPNSVITIGDGVFRNNTNLTSVIIGNSVTSIGVFTFEGCTSLRSITIGNSVTSIGVGAFSSCISLISITIPAGITSIGVGAFIYDSLASVTFNRSNTTIVHAFLGNLTDMYASGGAGTYTTDNPGWNAEWIKQ